MTKLDSDPTSSIGLHPEEVALRRFLERTRGEDASPAAGVVRELQRVQLANQTSTFVKTLGDLIPVDDPSAAELPIVVTADGRTIDVVLPATTAPANLARHLGAALDAIELEGPTINVLVPLAQLGAAHTACHDTAIATIQPYWVRGETVVFGAQETP